MATAKNNKPTIKSLKELSILSEYTALGGKDTQDILKGLIKGRTDELAKTLDILKKIKSATIDIKELEEDITSLIEDTNDLFTKGLSVYPKALEITKKSFEELRKAQKEINKDQEKTNIYLKAANAIWEDTSRILDTVVRQNKEIYEISHNMQTESNITWRQFTEL